MDSIKKAAVEKLNEDLKIIVDEFIENSNLESFVFQSQLCILNFKVAIMQPVRGDHLQLGGVIPPMATGGIISVNEKISKGFIPIPDLKEDKINIIIDSPIEEDKHEVDIKI